MSAAHGFAQVSGRPQAVLVHVECGTQALAGAVHNAAKGRAPMLVFAGASPFTQEGELRGSRNEFIQWIQDVHDQRGIVRGYMKYDNEIRTGRNVKQLVHRALQIADVGPEGAGLPDGRARGDGGGARRAGADRRPAAWRPVAPLPLPDDAVAEILAALRDGEAAARRHLLSRPPARGGGRAGALLRGGWARACSNRCPCAMNFPHDHPLYQGNQWNDPRQNPALAEADCILVIDSDVPWIPTRQPAGGGGGDLPHRRRSAEGADAALVHRRAPVAARRCGDGAPPAQRGARRHAASTPRRCAPAPRTTRRRARTGARELADARGGAGRA